MKIKFDKILGKLREADAQPPAGETYTGTSAVTVGGIASGTSFADANIQTMFQALLEPELFPTLTNPSSTFNFIQAGLQEIGLIIPTLNFSATFSRGVINPAYGTSGFRSGLPNMYNYTGTGVSSNASTSLSDAETVSGYTVLTGGQNWTGSVSYDAGEQPKSSLGNNYSTPLPAGTTSAITRTITGVYPFFATTSSIITLTKQALSLMNSAYAQVAMIAESGSDKQKIEFPVAWSAITGVQFYNTVSSAWEWIGGSQAVSLTKFTVTSTTETIQGNIVNYNLWTHNDVLTGSRQLRFYTT